MLRMCISSFLGLCVSLFILSSRAAGDVIREDVVGLDAAASLGSDLEIDLKPGRWISHTDWLGNPTEQCRVTNEQDAGTLFEVEAARRGMKWSHPLEPGMDLTGHGYLVIQYSGSGLAPNQDYALALLGDSFRGMDYSEVIKGADLIPDGQPHTLAVPLLLSSPGLTMAKGIAIQVQAKTSHARLLLKKVWLTSTLPALDVREGLPYTPGADFTGFGSVDLSPGVNQALSTALHAGRLTGWPESPAITVAGVPFQLKERGVATGIEAQGKVSIPVNEKTCEIHLALIAVMKGQEEPVYGTGAFRQIRDVDRFRIGLAYEDGSLEEAMPCNLVDGSFGVRAGPQGICLWPDRTRRLSSVILDDRCSQAGFVVASCTILEGDTPLFLKFKEDFTPEPVRRWKRTPRPGRFSIRLDEEKRTALIETGLMAGHFEAARACCTLRDKIAGQDLWSEPRAFLRVTKAGRLVSEKDLNLLQMAKIPGTTMDNRFALSLVYEIKQAPGVRIKVLIGTTEAGALRFSTSLSNQGQSTDALGIEVPRVGPYILGQDLAENSYVIPCRGALVGREDVDLDTRYSGLFNLQFMATVNPGAGLGLHLRTEDQTCIERRYLFRKDKEGLFMAVSYPERPLAPGQVRVLADTLIEVGDGDWHRPFDAYRAWMKTWYRPVSPRQAWFRESFNFRQRFLYWLDPLYNSETGLIDLDRAIREAQESFGGADYLHLFDWGYCGPYGRIYGRVGDYSPYDYLKGGQASLRDAMAKARSSGVPVGLYIEGYLMDERGRLGQAHGTEWQIRTPKGEGVRWPDSTEIYICPGVEAWRLVQAETYATKVKELDSDGMYIDQFGFTGPDKDCSALDHGHPVPSNPVLMEQEASLMIRKAVDAAKPGVVLYTEESPCDVSSQYQDGSFTYAMNQIQARQGSVPLNLFRFAIPDFKTFEILYCDKPTGSWATGVGWTFFNGEGLWLEGPGNDWFAAETREMIQKCHALLRDHRAAFTTLTPEPIVSTCARGVFANAFAAEEQEIWTLYNAHHRTYSGPVIEVLHREGAVWQDAWNPGEVRVERLGDHDRIWTRLAPQGVGCLERIGRPR